MYYTKYLGVEDEESLGTSRAEAGQEGFMSAFAVFMVHLSFRCDFEALMDFCLQPTVRLNSKKHIKSCTIQNEFL